MVFSESVKEIWLTPRALILTVDSAIGDHRQKTEKMRGTKGDAEAGIRMGPHIGQSPYHDPRLNWEDLKWLKELAKGTPIYLKGVSHIDVRVYNLSELTKRMSDW